MAKRNKSPNNNNAPRARSGASVPLASPLFFPAGVALIVIVAFWAYFPCLSGGFIFDDNGLLTENKLINSSDGLYRFWCTTEADDYWPMTNTTFWIEWRIWGMNPRGYHVTNLVLHIVESSLIWIILRKLAVPGAFLAAVIFAMHPVNVESVAWISSRKNLMAMLFFLLSILCYLKFIERARLRLAAKQSTSSSLIPHPSSLIPHPSSLFYWLSLGSFVLAMLGKGSVAVLPVLLLGIVWWLRPLTRRDLTYTAPFFMVALVLAGVNVWFQTHGREIVVRSAGFVERLLGAGSVVWFYLYKALLPLDLAFVYPQWHIQAGNPLCWLPLLAALLVTATLWRYRESWGRPILFAWGFFCVALAPVMGFTEVGFMKYSLVADHYQHIAIIGVISLAAGGFSVWQQQARGGVRSAATVAAILAVGVLAFLTWRQSGIYCDALRLYQATLEKNPRCWMAHNNLGLTLVDMGRPQEAIEHCKQALLLKPDFAEAYNNLGLALVESGREQEAIENYRQALLLKPDYVKARYNLGNSLTNLGRLPEAIEQFKQALSLDPDYAEAHNNLGIALFQTGRTPEAIEHCEQALRLKPGFSDAHFNLGNFFQAMGQYQRAIENYEQALRIKPDDPEAHYNLGIALVQTDRPLEAVEHYKQTLRLKPNHPGAHNNMGVALVQTDRPREAIEHYRQALLLSPDSSNVYYNLALAYARLNQSAEATDAAQKALELAGSQGQTTMAKQIEDWLNSYRAGLPDLPKVPRPSESVTQPD